MSIHHNNWILFFIATTSATLTTRNTTRLRHNQRCIATSTSAQPARPATFPGDYVTTSYVTKQWRHNYANGRLLTPRKLINFSFNVFSSISAKSSFFWLLIFFSNIPVVHSDLCEEKCTVFWNFVLKKCRCQLFVLFLFVESRKKMLIFCFNVIYTSSCFISPDLLNW